MKLDHDLWLLESFLTRNQSKEISSEPSKFRKFDFVFLALASCANISGTFVLQLNHYYADFMEAQQICYDLGGRLGIDDFNYFGETS